MDDDDYDEEDNDRSWDVGDEFDEGTNEDPQITLDTCLEKFRSPDYIMEPGVCDQLRKYFQAGGGPEQVIDLLSTNYKSIAQMANLVLNWLLLAGIKLTEGQAMVENHLKEMIVKTFDPKKADTIFTEMGETPSWLPEMIAHTTWRSLIYRLAEEYPDCLMLNFTIKLISDAGYQAEITSISTAAQQMEVFSSVLKNSISNYLLGGHEEQNKYVEECAKMVCHGQHTYVYSSVLLQVLSQENKGGVNTKRLYQEITKCARQKHDVTVITMALNGASNFPGVAEALSSMLGHAALNPADISVLYRYYSSFEPPPVELLRVPQFLELLVDSLFKPGIKLNPEHKPKYIYLLAYASSVFESAINKKLPTKKHVNKEELNSTMQAIEKVHNICFTNSGSTELIAEITTLYQCIRFPVVSVGIIRWVECTVTDTSYFKLCTEHTPTHLALLDEVAACHPVLHLTVLRILIDLFESKQYDLEILVELEIRKMLLDRMVNLLCCGCVVPVVKYVKQCWQHGDTDISLVRYFVTEVLEAISPPYSTEFVNLFLPIVENDEITGTMRCCEGDTDPVSEFIVYCKGMTA